MKLVLFALGVIVICGVGASRLALKEVKDEDADLLCDICKDEDVEINEEDRKDLVAYLKDVCNQVDKKDTPLCNDIAEMADEDIEELIKSDPKKICNSLDIC